MEAKPVSDEELNFCRFGLIVFRVFPKVLREIFIKLWNKKFPSILWDDSVEVRKKLKLSESKGLKSSGKKGNKKTEIPTEKSIKEWDCTALFQATIYAKTFVTSKGSTLNDTYLTATKSASGSFHPSVESSKGNQEETYALTIDQLRLLRNELCHINNSKIIKTHFDDNLQRVTDALKAAKADTSFLDEVNEIKEYGFGLEKVREIEERLVKELEAIKLAGNVTDFSFFFLILLRN